MKLGKIYDEHGWAINGFIFAMFFMLSLYGFSPCIDRNSCEWLADEYPSRLDILFYTFQMLILNYGGIHGDVPWTVQSARFGLPFVASISFIKFIFEVAAEKNAMLRLHSWQGHIVFLGGGNQSRAVLQQLLHQDERHKIVVVDIKEISDSDLWRSKGVVVLRENATLEGVLRRVRVKLAKCVYIMAGSDQTNLQILHAFKSVAGSHPQVERACCILNMYEFSLKQALDRTLLEDHLKNESGWDIRAINAWENSARSLLTGDFAPHNKCPQGCQPHALILGHSWLAEQLIIWGARLGHYSHGQKLRITYVDSGADHFRDTLYARYPVLDPFSAEHWHATERALLPVIDVRFLDKPAEGLAGEQFSKIIREVPLSVIYICHSDEDHAIRILAAVEANLSGMDNKPCVVFCQTRSQEGEVDFSVGRLSLGADAYFNSIEDGLKLKPNEYVTGGIREDWAKQIHDHYKNKYGGGNWERLDMDKRDSNRQSADHWKIKRDIYFSGLTAVAPEQIEPLQAELRRLEHQRWCAERFMSGWRYCNKPSNLDTDQLKSLKKENDRNKRNWCLCAYDQLSLEDQHKDGDMCEIAAKLWNEAENS